MTCTDKSTPGVTTWRAQVDERFLNPAGVIQGGFLAAMMDSAMGASAVTAVGERRVSVSNTEMKVTFLRSATVGDVLTCVATVLKAGRVISFVEAKVTDQVGRLVASASSSYLVRERPE